MSDGEKWNAQKPDKDNDMTNYDDHGHDISDGEKCHDLLQV